MEKIIKKQVETEVVEDIVCNCCGLSCKRKVATTRDDVQYHNHIYATISAHWGWGSNKDMEKHTSHICESCYDKFISTFKIEPDIDFRMRL